MTFDQWTKLLEIFVSFLQTISWPLIALAILLTLRIPLKKFLENIIEVTLKAGPIETTARRQKIIEVGTSLGAASAYRESTAQDNKSLLDTEKTRDIAKSVNQLITPDVTRLLAGTMALWVDDKPINNTYERQALEALGIQFTISKSTESALEKLKQKQYDVIISDMARPPDQQAGYVLLEKVKEMGITTPFIIYAGSKRPEHIAEAQRRGAFGTTNDPQELFEMIIFALADPLKAKQQRRQRADSASRS